MPSGDKLYVQIRDDDEPQPARVKSIWPAKYQQILTECLGGVLCATYTLITNLITVNIIFSARGYGSYLEIGAAAALIGTAVSTATWAYASELPIVCNADTFMASLYAESASSIMQQLTVPPPEPHFRFFFFEQPPETPPPGSPIGTLALMMAFSTAATGLLLFLMGIVRMGLFAQYAPLLARVLHADA